NRGFDAFTARFTDEEIVRTIGRAARRIGAIRSRYVDGACRTVSMVERLGAWRFTVFVNRSRSGGPDEEES
ncbi:MAG: hypothetical protein P4L87_00445, partial [Formivibrio sp.]|nr:hypothetical protein [Formivibrio sp.]